MVYGLLSSAYPISGGDYQYLSRMVHPMAGYLFGWSAFFVTYSGSVAALAIAAAYYLDGTLLFVNFDLILLKIGFFEFSLIKVIAILAILFFTWVNYRGIIISGRFQILLTGGIFILLIGFAIAGSISTEIDTSRLQQQAEMSGDITGFLTALIAVLFSYMGWTTAVYVAEEIENARKILPKALLVGVILVAIIYLWINVVYLLSLSLAEMRGVVNIGSLIAEHLWGGYGQIVVSLLILVAILRLAELNHSVGAPDLYGDGTRRFFDGKNRKAPFRLPGPACRNHLAGSLEYRTCCKRQF